MFIYVYVYIYTRCRRRGRSGCRGNPYRLYPRHRFRIDGNTLRIVSVRTCGLTRGIKSLGRVSHYYLCVWNRLQMYDSGAPLFMLCLAHPLLTWVYPTCVFFVFFISHVIRHTHTKEQVAELETLPAPRR